MEITTEKKAAQVADEFCKKCIATTAKFQEEDLATSIDLAATPKAVPADEVATRH